MLLGPSLLCATVGFAVGCALRSPADRLASAGPAAPAPRSRPPAAVTLGAVTAALFATLAWRLGPGLDLVAFFALAAGGVVLTLVDLRTLRLPDIVTGAILLAGLSLLGIEALAVDEIGSYLRALAGAVVLAAYHFALAVVRRGALGFGDVKLAAVLGLHLSWLGWGELIAGAALSFVGAGTAAAFMLASGRARLDTPLAFGPWMLLGALGGVLFGAELTEAYRAW
ncbi:MAG: prepilin peptidase [Streptomycetaceae bacterium]|nr:prepilin peptidase [Streptomycetaceae bacterium]